MGMAVRDLTRLSRGQSGGTVARLVIGDGPCGTEEQPGAEARHAEADGPECNWDPGCEIGRRMEVVRVEVVGRVGDAEGAEEVGAEDEERVVRGGVEEGRGG